MEYELINPSDPYTFIAEDHEVAVLTVFCLGTQYGATPMEGDKEVPIFLFSGASGAAEWYKETFRRTTDEGLRARKEAVADALASFMLGHFEDRRRYNAALDAITDPAKKEEFIAAWQDGRSSVNDIGTYAHNISKNVRTLGKEEKDNA